MYCLKNQSFTRTTDKNDLNFINKLDSPKIIWIMLPSGQTTEDMLLDLPKKLHKGDLIIDGGNKTTVARHKVFKK